MYSEDIATSVIQSNDSAKRYSSHYLSDYARRVLPQDWI